MTDELYRSLGLERDATEVEIRVAYRARAKIHHPDMPHGHRELFEEITEAYEVLGDPESRAAYDRDGTIKDKKIDAERRHALTIIGQFINDAMAEVTSTAAEPVYNGDVVAVMRALLREKIKKIEEGAAKELRDAKRLKGFAARFHVPEGKPNIYAEMIEAKIRTHERMQGQAAEDLQHHHLALEIMEGAWFEVAAAQAVTTQSQFAVHSGQHFWRPLP